MISYQLSEFFGGFFFAVVDHKRFDESFEIGWDEKFDDFVWAIHKATGIGLYVLMLKIISCTACIIHLKFYITYRGKVTFVRHVMLISWNQQQIDPKVFAHKSN